MAFSLIAFSFASCAIAYAGLALMLRPSRFGRGAPRLRLRLAALVTSAWALGTWWAVAAGRLDSQLAHVCAIGLSALWLWQLQPLARWQAQPAWLQWLLNWGGALVFGTALLFFALDRPDSFAIPDKVLPSAGLLLAAIGLFALEQIYRNAGSKSQSAIRWLCLGFGGIFVSELMVSSQALLVGAVPFEPWLARGVVFALCAAAIARGALRMPDWSFGVSISRHVVFYSTSFVIIGAYLVLLSAGGWLILAGADQWGRWAQISFALLGMLTFVGLTFSGTLLRRWRAFISKHFYPHRYDYRHEWLRFIRTLSQADDASTVPQRCIRAVLQILESPQGTLWRLDESGMRFERAEGWPDDLEASVRAVDADDPLAQFLENSKWLIDLVELREQPQLYDHLQLEGERYALSADALIVPLLHGEQLYGWLVLERPAGLKGLSFEDRDLLKTAGLQIATHLVQYYTQTRLAQARQFEAYNRMTAFVMHDLKNIAAQLRLISQNAERHRRNPEFVDDAMRTIGSSAARMTKLIAQLTSGETGTMQTCDLATVAERAALRCGAHSPVPQLAVIERPTVFAEMERLGSVIEHAIRNAQDATPGEGEVRVEIDCRQGQPLVRIVDTGCGMDTRFVRERLFRPFDTTKGTRGMGIGAFQIREYLRALGGDVEVHSVPGHGTTMTLVFPVSATHQLRASAAL